MVNTEDIPYQEFVQAALKDERREAEMATGTVMYPQDIIDGLVGIQPHIQQRIRQAKRDTIQNPKV